MSLLKRLGARADRDAERDRQLMSERDSARSSAGQTRPGQSRAGKKMGILRTCANPQCGSGWLRLWRSRETPIFEGGWCCSAACTQARVEAALRREMDGRGAAREPHRHRIPLGLAMLEQGWITPVELRTALAAQRTEGSGRLGEWLVLQRSSSEELVTRALGLQWSCPVLSMEFHNPEDLTALLPRLFIDAFGALPLRVAAGKILYLGFEDRVDQGLALATERMTGLHSEAGLVQGSLFRPAHARALESHFPSVELIEAATEQALAAAFGKALEESRPVEARLVRIHDCIWLRIWLERQAGPVPESDSIRDLIASTAAH
jgi:Type II secretion system (T2SS), protein E, N-terminal domain